MFKWLKVGLIIIIGNGFIHIGNLKAEERDPFISIFNLGEQKPVLPKRLTFAVLRGIIRSESQAVAIINDELVTAGDNWQGFKVDTIDKDSVTLSDEGGSYKLLFEDSPSNELLSDIKEDILSQEESTVKEEQR